MANSRQECLPGVAVLRPYERTPRPWSALLRCDTIISRRRESMAAGKSYRLSVLDVSPVASGSTSSDALRNTLDLAQLADKLGFTRYWLAEHHNTPLIASSAPEIMIGHVASVTRH